MADTGAGVDWCEGETAEASLSDTVPAEGCDSGGAGGLGSSEEGKDGMYEFQRRWRRRSRRFGRRTKGTRCRRRLQR